MMVLKRAFCVVLACMIVVSCLGASAGAVEKSAAEVDLFAMRATGSFNLEIPAKKTVQASSSFPLEAGEVVTINASYSPFSASMDFGLIAPDGFFYSVNVTNGSVDQEIEVEQRGNYTFAVRNNSSYTVSVSGFVNY